MADAMNSWADPSWRWGNDGIRKSPTWATCSPPRLAHRPSQEENNEPYINGLSKVTVMQGSAAINIQWLPTDLPQMLQLEVLFERQLGIFSEHHAPPQFVRGFFPGDPMGCSDCKHTLVCSQGCKLSKAFCWPRCFAPFPTQSQPGIASLVPIFMYSSWGLAADAFLKVNTWKHTCTCWGDCHGECHLCSTPPCIPALSFPA